MADEVITSLYGPALGEGFTIVAGPDDVYADEDLLGEEGGDFEIVDGDLRWTDGPEQARQEVECRMSFWLGEYFLDTRQGMPYRRDVLVKNPNKEAILSIFRRAILSVPGLIDPKVTYTLDAKSRKLSITWDARWIDGQPLTPIGPKTLEVLIG